MYKSPAATLRKSLEEVQSSGPHSRHERVDFRLELIALTRQRLGGRQNLARGRTSLGGAAVRVADITRGERRARCRLGDVARDLVRRGVLLLDSRRNGRRDLRDA